MNSIYDHPDLFQKKIMIFQIIIHNLFPLFFFFEKEKKKKFIRRKNAI